jgi:hypothetical protein
MHPLEEGNDRIDVMSDLVVGVFLLAAFVISRLGEIVRFVVSKSERERARLIREARAIYDSIFPPADPIREQHDKAPISHTVSGANAHRSDGGL